MNASSLTSFSPGYIDKDNELIVGLQTDAPLKNPTLTVGTSSVTFNTTLKGGEYIDVPDVDLNPYWKRICKLSDAQRKKGMETYGQGLESNPAAMLKRIEHLQEELVDALMYCEWIKDKLGLEGGSE